MVEENSGGLVVSAIAVQLNFFFYYFANFSLGDFHVVPQLPYVKKTVAVHKVNGYEILHKKF